MEIIKSEISKIILKELGLDVILQNVSKMHSCSDNFICETSNKRFFCRTGSREKIESHINGENMINKYLPVPKTLSKIYKINSDIFFCLQECCDGDLFANHINKIADDEIVYIENVKEGLLIKLYKETLKQSEISDYLGSNSQKLFIGRILGQRYEEFFGKNSEIWKLCSKTLFLNGKKITPSISEIFKQILDKIELLKENSKSKIWTILSHSDLHHGNIIINKSFIHIIDLEYTSEFVTPNMDIAKPYYNDLIGILFFHDQSNLKKYIDIEYTKTDKEIYLKINKIVFPKIRLDITRVKIQQRKQLFNFSLNKNDLSVVDYLILCHTLTKNPSLYPESVQIVFIYVLYSIYYMDWENPNSLFNDKLGFE